MNLVLIAAAIHLASFGLALMMVSIKRGSKELPPFELWAKGLATISAIGALLVLFDIYMLLVLVLGLIVATWITIKTEEASFSHRAQFVWGAVLTTAALMLASDSLWVAL